MICRLSTQYNEMYSQVNIKQNHKRSRGGGWWGGGMGGGGDGGGGGVSKTLMRS